MRSRMMSLTAKLVPTFQGALQWDFEKVYVNGDAFFERLCEAIDQATTRIDLEFYIFASDELGLKIVKHLANAVERGVKVRLLVDAVGSYDIGQSVLDRLQRLGLEVRKFHPVQVWDVLYQEYVQKSNHGPSYYLKQINKRNHRKVVIIDHEIAFVGSRNVFVGHTSMGPERPWRDTSLELRGDYIQWLEWAFEKSWGKELWRWKYRSRAWKDILSAWPVRLNTGLKLRAVYHKDLLRRIDRAQHEICLTTAYFLPRPKFVRCLVRAVKRGVKVRLLVGEKSDIAFFPIIQRYFYNVLIKGGVEIYEYGTSILHAKSLFIDDWHLVGTSNLNFRSLFHDLEVDIVVSHPESKDQLRMQFEKDLTESKRIYSFAPKWWMRLIMWPLYRMRWWL